jgi:hypothetical protein
VLGGLGASLALIEICGTREKRACFFYDILELGLYIIVWGNTINQLWMFAASGRRSGHCIGKYFGALGSSIVSVTTVLVVGLIRK